MSLKKTFATVLSSTLMCTNFFATRVSGEEKDSSETPKSQTTLLSESNDTFSQEKFSLKTQTSDEEKTEFSFSSSKKNKFDLFFNDNLNIALKKGLEFILKTENSEFINNKASLNECIIQNSLLCECITSTIKYINNKDISKNDKHFDILKRLTSIQKLMEIDQSISSDNAFFRFVSAMKNAYQTKLSRDIASVILSDNCNDVENKMNNENASGGANVGTGFATGTLSIGISAGVQNEESSSEKSFYKIDNSSNFRISIGTGFRNYLSANAGYNLGLTNTLVFYSLEQFLDTCTAQGKVSSLELREPEIKKIMSSREKMQQDEKRLLSSIGSSVEWYLKMAQILPQNTIFVWPDVTFASSACSQNTVSQKCNINAVASCFASLGMDVSTGMQNIDTSAKHSYLSLLQDDCSISPGIENAEQIASFLKKDKVKKYIETKQCIEEYLLKSKTDSDMRKSDVVSIIVSNIIGDIRQYSTALSVLADESSTPEQKESAKSLKHLMEANWIGRSKIITLHKGRLEMLETAISIASYLREFAGEDVEVEIFKKLYSELEHLSKMQIFSNNVLKQKALFETKRKSKVRFVNGQLYFDVPLAGTSSMDLTYSDSKSEAYFDTSQDITLNLQVPMFGDKILGKHSIKNKFENLINTLSENTDNSLSLLLAQSLELIDADFQNILKDYNIDIVPFIPNVFSTNKYMNLIFYLTKIDKTDIKVNEVPLPNEDKLLLKSNDEWVLKLVKRVDSVSSKLKLGMIDPVDINANASVGKASALIGTDTLTFISNRYNVFSTGLRDKSDKNNYLWDKFKTGQANKFKELFKNICNKNSNVRYELQALWNQALRNINQNNKLSLIEKELKIKKCTSFFENFLSSSEEFLKNESVDNFKKVSDCFDNILKINYKYNYITELQRVHSINK